MSGDAKLKSYIDRILRCRETEDAAKEDTKAVYAELASDGYEKAVVGQVITFLRKREKDGDKLSEQSAKFDLYLDAYERPSHVHTRVGLQNTPSDAPPASVAPAISPSGSANGETDSNASRLSANSPETAQVPSSEQSEGNGSRGHQHVHSRQTDGAADHGRQDGQAAAPDHEGDAAANAIGIPALDQPATANEVPAQDGEGTGLGESLSGKSDTALPASREAALNDGIAAGQTAVEVVTVVGTESGTVANSDQPLTGGDHEVAGTNSAATGEGGALPDRPKSRLRPNCLQPGMCRSGTRDHCYSCTKSMKHEEAAA